MLILPMNSIRALREEGAQEAFLERFGTARPHLSGEAIDRAFHEGLLAVAPSEHVEMLERKMDQLLGIVSDEEE